MDYESQEFYDIKENWINGNHRDLDHHDLVCLCMFFENECRELSDKLYKKR